MSCHAMAIPWRVMKMSNDADPQEKSGETKSNPMKASMTVQL